MKASYFVALFVVAAVVLVTTTVPEAEAVNCTPTELSPCAGAIFGSGTPSGACCNKIREQKPCLCGYLKDPTLKQYVNSPNARKVANTCGVPFPSC